ncbi:hypothetical protein, partial [Campylobacter sp. RM16191]|uniref:hypothetical protein n=1 Tax=Campylobacter sp. RM16191 TaxID=1705728 RepID=UPI001475F821
RLNEASGFTKAITGATIGLSNAFSGLSVYAEQVSSAVWLLVKGFIAYKGSVIGANLYTSLFNKTMNGMYTNSFIASLSRAGSVMDVLKVGAGAAATAFKTLRGAMMSVLPVAGIMLAIEVVGRLAESFGGAKERNEELRKSIELTSEEIKKLSVNELNNHLITLAKEQDNLTRSIEGSEYALSRLDEEFQDEEQRAQAFDAITAGAGKFESRLEMVKDRIKEIKEQIEGLSNPNSAKGQFLQTSAFIDKILEDHKNIKTKIDIEDEIKLEVERITKLSELTGITAENERSYLNAKEKTLAKLIKLNDEYENFGKEKTKNLKDHINMLKAALKDIAEVNFSDMELKTQRVLDRYNEIISLGIDKGKAKHFLDSKLEAIANENIKAVEKSEAEAIAKQLDLRAQYYKSIGEYENAWQIEKQKIIEKYEKLTFANGEKLTKEQLDKLLKMEKTAFLQGAKIAKNS